MHVNHRQRLYVLHISILLIVLLLYSIILTKYNFYPRVYSKLYPQSKLFAETDTGSQGGHDILQEQDAHLVAEVEKWRKGRSL